MFKRKRKENTAWRMLYRVIAFDQEGNCAFYSPYCVQEEQDARQQSETTFTNIEWYFEDNGTMNAHAFYNNVPVVVKIVRDYPAK